MPRLYGPWFCGQSRASRRSAFERLGTYAAEMAVAAGSVVERLDIVEDIGTPRKLMYVARLAAAGRNANIPLDRGLREVYDWFKAHIADGTLRCAA